MLRTGDQAGAQHIMRMHQCYTADGKEYSPSRTIPLKKVNMTKVGGSYIHEGCVAHCQLYLLLDGEDGC